jgi:hypothetical protein
MLLQIRLDPYATLGGKTDTISNGMLFGSSAQTLRFAIR